MFMAQLLLPVASSPFATMTVMLAWVSRVDAVTTEELNQQCLADTDTTITARYNGESFGQTTGTGWQWSATPWPAGNVATIVGPKLNTNLGLDTKLNGHPVPKGTYVFGSYIEFQPSLSASYTIIQLCKRLPSYPTGLVLTAKNGENGLASLLGFSGEYSCVSKIMGSLLTDVNAMVAEVRLSDQIQPCQN